MLPSNVHLCSPQSSLGKNIKGPRCQSRRMRLKLSMGGLLGECCKMEDYYVYSAVENLSLMIG